MKPIVIFDLDGTLMNIEHRMHFIKETPKDYHAFYKACSGDTPIPQVVTMFKLLQPTHDVRIWSCRSDIALAETVSSLRYHGIFDLYFNQQSKPNCLRLKPDSDHRKDDVVKVEWLSQLPDDERARLYCTFEDRARVAEMWRNAGVMCFQVAKGDF